MLGVWLHHFGPLTSLRRTVTQDLDLHVSSCPYLFYWKLGQMFHENESQHQHKKKDKNWISTKSWSQHCNQNWDRDRYVSALGILGLASDQDFPSYCRLCEQRWKTAPDMNQIDIRVYLFMLNEPLQPHHQLASFNKLDATAQQLLEQSNVAASMWSRNVQVVDVRNLCGHRWSQNLDSSWERSVTLTQTEHCTPPEFQATHCIPCSAVSLGVAS